MSQPRLSKSQKEDKELEERVEKKIINIKQKLNAQNREKKVD